MGMGLYNLLITITLAFDNQKSSGTSLHNWKVFLITIKQADGLTKQCGLSRGEDKFLAIFLGPLQLEIISHCF